MFFSLSHFLSLKSIQKKKVLTLHLVNSKESRYTHTHLELIKFSEALGYKIYKEKPILFL